MIGSILDRLHDEFRRIWRYRWLAAAVALAVLSVALPVSLLLPSVYEAWGQIYVNRETPLTAAASGVSLVGENYGSPYVIQKTLLNDDNLQAVARRLEPRRAFTDAEMTAALDKLRRRTRIVDGGDGFVEIRFTDSSPRRAESVVRLLLQQFIGGNVNRAQRDLGQAGAFLDEQIASYETMIAESKARVAAFRRQRMPVTPAFETVEVAVEAGEVAPPPPPPQVERIKQLEGRLANLLTSYTEQYPDVIATRRQIDDAKAELAATPQAEVADTPQRPLTRRVTRRREAQPLSAEVATQWSELQRRDERLRANYEQLLAKRAATQMSQAVYDEDRAGKYQVTHAPVVPTTPVGPNRKLYLAVGLLLALASGVGVAYLRAALRGILISSREIEEVIQLPVIGTVSYEPAWRTRSHFARVFTSPPKPRPQRQTQLLLNLSMETAR